jgi:hypothetical protein
MYKAGGGSSHGLRWQRYRLAGAAVVFALELGWVLSPSRYHPHYRLSLGHVGGSDVSFLIGPFKFKFDHLNMNLII